MHTSILVERSKNKTSIMTAQTDLEFPCSLFVTSGSSSYFGRLTRPARTIDLPLPTARLASAALQALRVDKELSPLVRRLFSTISTASCYDSGHASVVNSSEQTILRTEYKATTNRMLRVAVNGFMESLSVVLGIMEELDVDVLDVEHPKE
jgi:EKC/KEOPS complex subunit PCC1/LAGE3